MKPEFIKIVQALTAFAVATSKGCRFVSLTYQGKGKPGETPDLARYTLLLGVSLERAYKRDVATLTRKNRKLTGISKVACEELLASLKQSLTVGIGHNEAYTCKDVYETILPGVKVHKETGEIHVYGFVTRKDVLVKGQYRTVNSAEKTIAKNALRKTLKTGRFRQFALNPENLHRVAVNGNAIEIE